MIRAQYGVIKQNNNKTGLGIIGTVFLKTVLFFSNSLQLVFFSFQSNNDFKQCHPCLFLFRLFMLFSHLSSTRTFGPRMVLWHNQTHCFQSRHFWMGPVTKLLEFSKSGAKQNASKRPAPCTLSLLPDPPPPRKAVFLLLGFCLAYQLELDIWGIPEDHFKQNPSAIHPTPNSAN